MANDKEKHAINFSQKSWVPVMTQIIADWMKACQSEEKREKRGVCVGGGGLHSRKNTFTSRTGL